MIFTIGFGLIYKFFKLPSPILFTAIGHAIQGTGYAMIICPAQLVLQISCAHGDIPTLTGIFLAFSCIGDGLGSSISGSIWQQLLPDLLHENLPYTSIKDLDHIFESVKGATEYSDLSDIQQVVDYS